LSQPSPPERAEMLGMDLLTGGTYVHRAVQERTDENCTLSQNETGSAVQEAPRLAMAQRDRHPHHDAVTGRFGQLVLRCLGQAFQGGDGLHVTGLCAHCSSPLSVWSAVLRLYARSDTSAHDDHWLGAWSVPFGRETREGIFPSYLFCQQAYTVL